MFLASVAHETKHIVLGSGTINMPNGHPAAIAAQVAMLDHMLKGRFIMGISPGGLMSDAEVFGNYQKDRNAIFLESINMVLDIWTKDSPYDLEGKFFRSKYKKHIDPRDRAGHHPQALPEAAPAHRRHGGGAALEGRDRGGQARLDADLGQLPAARVGGIALAPLRGRTRGRGREGPCPRSGASRSPSSWPTTTRSPKRYGRSAEGPYHFYFKQLVRKLVGFGGRGNLFKLDQSQPDAEITPDYVTRKLVIAGTVNSVVDQILAFREKIGDFGTLLYACHDWMDPALGKRSMQLMAEQVMPRVNAALK